jgi:pyruvate-ferredoxin/flavodoxin oxidoreductase
VAIESVTWDANEATADVAFRTNEVIAIYPITPASPMGEHADTWSSQKRANIWGDVPRVIEMQSEAGAAGTVHGSLQAGALTTTFTASQGLLLMIPNMYKIAGELTSAVIHVAARSIATHALSIFGDHSDVYAARQTGFAMLCSGSVQEAHDFALIAHSATLTTRLPFLHFFDGFRTSHEVAKTQRLTDAQVAALIDAQAVQRHRDRAISPDHPVVRGTAQNADVFFQAREAVNPFYDRAPDMIQQAFDQLAEQSGRQYSLFDYVGHPQADRVLIMMGSGAEVAHETVDWMNTQADKVGVLKVRLYRPFSPRHLIAALPKTVRRIAVLDRTKEPGAPGEPLYLDVVCALAELRTDETFHFDNDPVVVGGRYGLSSKEFDPGMVKGVFDALRDKTIKNGFTIGIFDDVTHKSVSWDRDLDIEADSVTRCVFWGLGADGTVGANKNSIKIIGSQTDFHAQGYFVYDSKKSGAKTVSHLRFGPDHIRSSYLIKNASFVGCHQWGFLNKFDVLNRAAVGAVFLLNSPWGADVVWDHLPREIQAGIIDKGLSFYVTDAYKVARDVGMPGRINTIMQTCFFAISGVLPRDEAIGHIKTAIEKTYGRKGAHIVRMNHAVVDQALGHLHQVIVPLQVTSTHSRPPIVPDAAPEFVKNVTAAIIAGLGDDLPVSAFPPDGTWPVGTTKWEKRAIAETIPQWDAELCVQCNKCALVCPHAAIRAKVFDPETLSDAPVGFKAATWKGGALKGQSYTIQVAPDDCTGCNLCQMVCPAKDKGNPRHKAIDMVAYATTADEERAWFDWFIDIPEADRHLVRRNVKESQLLEPLFEFSGACAGCGETPYIKLLTQLFGDRTLIANATGCTSIYGGNLPTTPYSTNAQGRGPAWSNSLFEDNAEFGMGFRLAVDQSTARARRLLERLTPQLEPALVQTILECPQTDELQIEAQRDRVVRLRADLQQLSDPLAADLHAAADYLVRKSVWIVGGDGWAYDIGYGGLDHALASGLNVNIMVLDTEVYSNTGGQASKATPLGAVAKFAAGGKPAPKKDLGMLAMAYGNVYVAQIAFGAKDTQTVKALLEAEAWDGPSLIIAYSHCIAHGYDMADGLSQQKKAVNTGYWPLYRFDPRRSKTGEVPLQLDSGAPKNPLQDFMYNEARFRVLTKTAPERAKELLARAQKGVEDRFAWYRHLASDGEDAK